MGGPSGMPVSPHKPASAESCEPNPGWSARGPVCPMLQVASMIRRGLSSASVATPRPRGALPPPRPNVLDGEIAPLRHPLRNRDPLALFQIDCHAVLGVVEEREAAAAV